MENINIRITAYTPNKEFIGKANLLTNEAAFVLEEKIKSASIGNLEVLDFELETPNETVYLPKDILKNTIFVIKKVG